MSVARTKDLVKAWEQIAGHDRLQVAFANAFQQQQQVLKNLKNLQTQQELLLSNWARIVEQPKPGHEGRAVAATPTVQEVVGAPSPLPRARVVTRRRSRLWSYFFGGG